jgi:biopolymer transport protein TolR
MAGSISTSSSSSEGKKAVDFQLNMIPFIDLLSVLITFLLMSSVWIQVAKIDVKQGDPSSDPSRVPPDVNTRLTVLIKASGYVIARADTLPVEIADKGETYDTTTLGHALSEIHNEHRGNVNVEIVSEDRVPYRELITVMDTCLKIGLTDISVAGVDS